MADALLTLSDAGTGQAQQGPCWRRSAALRGGSGLGPLAWCAAEESDELTDPHLPMIWTSDCGTASPAFTSLAASSRLSWVQDLVRHPRHATPHFFAPVTDGHGGKAQSRAGRGGVEQSVCTAVCLRDKTFMMACFTFVSRPGATAGSSDVLSTWERENVFN